MENVQFIEEDMTGGDRKLEPKKVSWMIRLLLKTRLTSNEKVAYACLIVIAIVFFVLSYYVINKNRVNVTDNQYLKSANRVGHAKDFIPR